MTQDASLDIERLPKIEVKRLSTGEKVTVAYDEEAGYMYENVASIAIRSTCGIGNSLRSWLLTPPNPGEKGDIHQPISRSRKDKAWLRKRYGSK